MTHLIHFFIIASLSCAAISCSTGPKVSTPRQQLISIGKPPRTSDVDALTAEKNLRSAGKLTKKAPAEALALYLESLRLLDGSHSNWNTEASRLTLGNAIELAQQHQLWGKPCHSHNSESYTISLSNKVALEFDSLTYSAKYQCDRLKPAIIHRSSGVAMVGQYYWTPARKSTDPFLPRMGYTYAITAQSKWLSHNQLEIYLTSSRDSLSASYNFTAPKCIINQEGKNLQRTGIYGVFRPKHGTINHGLYSHEPLSPNRIPVILVHGLASTPTPWVKATHSMIQDSRILHHYQFFAYYYQTGLPIAYNAAQLKKQIKQLKNALTQIGSADNANNMVIIGHSMGGVISSILTRNFTTTTEQLFSSDPELVIMNKKSRDAILTILDDSPLKCIKRSIFIATPHRGSKSVNTWYGRLSSNLINIPQNIVSSSSENYQNHLTDLGQYLVPSKNELDGVKRLEYENPALMFTLSQPRLPWVKYHSIIGNRGRKGELTKSSDGVVEYHSSHLSNVESEKIVPSSHSAQGHPQSIAEIQRILLLHLQ